MLMVMLAYLPILALTRIEGLLFRPMALTMVYALGAALGFALFVVPVLATIFFRYGYQETEGRLAPWLREVYAKILRTLLAHRWLVLWSLAGLMAIVALRVGPRLGMEFLPYLDEGPVWIKASFPEGTSLEQTAAYGNDIRKIVLSFPEVQFSTAQVGRTEAWTEPFPSSRIEMMVGLKPLEKWHRQGGKPALVEALGARLRGEFPGTRFVFTQPIIDMVTQDANGSSANLAIQFSGPDLEILLSLADRGLAILRGIPGSRDVNLEQEGPQAQLRIVPDRGQCARHNVRIEDVTHLIDVALGGTPVGTLYEGDWRFDIVVKLDRQATLSPQAIGRLPIPNADGRPVPLSQVARIDMVDGQTVIAREAGERLITARCDIVGRDTAGFVKEAKEKFQETIAPLLPVGYRVSWMGMFENLERARKHFTLIIPLTVLLILGLLWATCRSLRAALIVLAGIPFSCVGGILALALRGMHMNVSTGVGFAALFGIAIMDGVLMVRGITVLRQSGTETSLAIVRGATNRIRPILITAIVAIFGLFPASIATGLGSDVQRPLATVIVWGLSSSTVLTLFVVPVLYAAFPPLVAHTKTGTYS
jgi:cobalt-zinc-cadmium resistance protein CzcA